ncbi:hypothetical protein COO60DRAFT_168960 [Scenedesmus sp. NREL 46B-D3]|nr:hypothetical protein COO60DRAFT_168960 [Scenedesmus sp. NREL 46B-D3]
MSSSSLLQPVRWRCSHLRVPACRRPCAVVTASARPDRATTTIGSLDELLGSRDEERAEATEQEQGSWRPIQLLRVPGWAWTEIREPRVVPLASNVLYYLLLVVYTSYYVVQLADGQQEADDLLLRLTNDHAAVASGDTLRLFTAFFVSDSLHQLIIGLLGLATVAAELESLLGYSTFWAVWCVTVLAGSVADAALSGMPITAGPAQGWAVRRPRCWRTTCTTGAWSRCWRRPRRGRCRSSWCSWRTRTTGGSGSSGPLRQPLLLAGMLSFPAPAAAVTRHSSSSCTCRACLSRQLLSWWSLSWRARWACHSAWCCQGKARPSSPWAVRRWAWCRRCRMRQTATH